jgi:hypothetical protein
MKIRKVRLTAGLAALALVASIPLATTALAAPAAVVGNITGDPVAPGQQATLTFSISPTQRTLASFTLAPPTNWQLVSGTASQGSVVGNQLVVTGLSVAPAGSATVTFDVKTGCKSGDWGWTIVEALDSQGRTYNTSATSDLSTNVNGNCTLTVTNEPENALRNALITGSAFSNPTNTGSFTDFVTVELRNGLDEKVPYFPVTVSFDLIAPPGIPSSVLSVTPELTDAGVATFDSGLSISMLNEPQFTSYKLTPKTVGTYPGLSGDESAGFDIWETVCSGSGCAATLRGGTPRGGQDVYQTTANTVLSASTLPASALAISCPGQKVIFSNSVFVHETSGSDPVLVTSTITVQDFRDAGTNYGQANVEWCVGIKPDDALALGNGGTYAPVFVDGDDVPDLYVGFAPRCPSKSPELSAPCIVSQTSDGKMGSVTTGYLQGGDPPRRT